MGRNFLPAVNDVEKVFRRKSTPVPLLKLCKIGRRFRQLFCIWAISFATDAMTACAIGFVRRLANALGVLRVGQNGSGSQRRTNYGASHP